MRTWFAVHRNDYLQAKPGDLDRLCRLDKVNRNAAAYIAKKRIIVLVSRIAPTTRFWKKAGVPVLATGASLSVVVDTCQRPKFEAQA